MSDGTKPWATRSIARSLLTAAPPGASMELGYRPPKPEAPSLSDWVQTAMRTMQDDAVRQAAEAGAVHLAYVGTRFEPDGEGGYTVIGEWEMGVPRG